MSSTTKLASLALVPVYAFGCMTQATAADDAAL